MQKPLTWTAVMVAGCAGLAAAQTKPDFSGRWTTEPAPAAAAQPAAAQAGAPPAAPRGGGAGRSGDMGSGWGSPITITQDGNRLTVEYAFFARGDMQPPLRFTYALDGSETKHSVMMGRGVQTQTSKAAWDADRLVITTTHIWTDPGSGKPTPTVVIQALSRPSPESLVVETTRVAMPGATPVTVRTVYRKI